MLNFFILSIVTLALFFLSSTNANVFTQLPEHAQEWMERAKEGDKESKLQLAKYYCTKYKYAEAVTLLQELTVEGDSGALNVLGTLLWHGYGVPRNVTKGIEYWRLAANGGDTEAQGRLTALTAFFALYEPTGQEKWERDRIDAVSKLTKIGVQVNAATIANLNKTVDNNHLYHLLGSYENVLSRTYKTKRLFEFDASGSDKPQHYSFDQQSFGRSTLHIIATCIERFPIAAFLKNNHQDLKLTTAHLIQFEKLYKTVARL
eukprot:PhF_6_TR36065/c0_g1_i3/m.52364